MDRINPYEWIGYIWIVVLAAWILTSFWSKKTIRKQSRGSRLGQIGLGVLAGVLLSGRIWKGPQLIPQNAETGWVGLALTLAGVALALWARFVLGRNWSGTVTVKHNHELVRGGPYRVVRHPIYSGFLLALLGTAVATGTACAFAGLVLAAVALRLKSLTEEQFMTEEFGAQYLEYKRETRALIPLLW
ncbi:MAG TPA: isoprenylcysteine carboxylmethyltransferase family protein [Bryobacteraceae bacterium]|jgi:protein-S-isoprenylcysteine O-methyltransferase|nr:isoprenylcysteine carboxylmethyltransferase family protein [Bryobacteraceae bacterium]